MASNSFVLIDQQPIVLEGVRLHILQIFPKAKFLYLGSNIGEAISAVGKSKVTCVVIDPNLSTEDSEAIALSKVRALGAPIFVLSQSNSGVAVSQAFSAGATGFFPKCASLYELRGGISSVISGGVYISPQVASDLSASQRVAIRLSDRERTALVLYTSGLTMDQVAISMSIASSTANEYINRARTKFRAAGKAARTKVDLRRLAVEEGLLINAS
jgi:DNA-binding NarL/FixJ family response regulator